MAARFIGLGSRALRRRWARALSDWSVGTITGVWDGARDGTIEDEPPLRCRRWARMSGKGRRGTATSGTEGDGSGIEVPPGGRDGAIVKREGPKLSSEEGEKRSWKHRVSQDEPRLRTLSLWDEQASAQRRTARRCDLLAKPRATQGTRDLTEGPRRSCHLYRQRPVQQSLPFRTAEAGLGK